MLFFSRDGLGRPELNPLPLHYQKVPILAKISNDLEEIKETDILSS